MKKNWQTDTGKVESGTIMIVTGVVYKEVRRLCFTNATHDIYDVLVTDAGIERRLVPNSNSAENSFTKTTLLQSLLFNHRSDENSFVFTILCRFQQ